MVHVSRKEGESIENMMRRFSMKLRGSGILQAAKAKKHFQRSQSRNSKKKSALHRARIQSYCEFLVKSGQYEDAINTKARR